MNKYIVVLVIALAAFTSCHKLDVKPPDIVSDDQVFTNEAGITAYLANVYRKLPIEDFTYRPTGRDGSGFNIHHEWEHFYHAGAACGEMVGPYGGMDIGNGFGYWPYRDIRAVNYFMETLPKYAAYYTDEKVTQLTGEAYFLRAFFYFGLAKRYGGIPIVRTVQNYPEQSIEELQVPRNTEEEVWNFIGEDLDKAYEMLPETSAPERANKYVAMALKSRAMLYAGSIAKHGSENFVDGDARALGFAGIPLESADGFYNRAIDAAKILEGHYSLYRGKADKIDNYVNVFLDPRSPENILVRNFFPNEQERCHSWDATFAPNSGMNYMTSEGLSRAYPTLEFVERFGEINVTNPDGTPRRYTNPAEVSQGLEPRLKATVYFPGDTLRGKIFDIKGGIYYSFNSTAAEEVAKPFAAREITFSADHNALYKDPVTNTVTNILIMGRAGMYPPVGGSPDHNTRTGFHVRKYINPNKTISEVKLFSSTTPWIELRYAEILLNRAEADIETGNLNDALICLNDIRERAGAPLLTLGDMNLEVIQNERCKELAFENHYWWDIKRWRIADQLLNNAHFKGLMPYYVYTENKYIFLKEAELFNRNYNFEKKFYYEQIPGGELGKNPNLYPNNPGY